MFFDVQRSNVKDSECTYLLKHVKRTFDSICFSSRNEESYFLNINALNPFLLGTLTSGCKYWNNSTITGCSILRKELSIRIAYLIKRLLNPAWLKCSILAFLFKCICFGSPSEEPSLFFFSDSKLKSFLCLFTICLLILDVVLGL